VNPIDRTRELIKTHKLVPAGITAASSEPLEVGEVQIFAGLRYVVVKKISKQDFERRRRENRVLRTSQEKERGFQFGEKPGDGGFVSNMNGAVADRDTAQMVDGPPPECKYYYALKWLP
jgi:hypothetical protein